MESLCSLAGISCQMAVATMNRIPCRFLVDSLEPQGFHKDSLCPRGGSVKTSLINEDGRFHPVLGPFSTLRPYHSSWHIYALPSTVSQHPALQELLATARDP